MNDGSRSEADAVADSSDDDGDSGDDDDRDLHGHNKRSRRCPRVASKLNDVTFSLNFYDNVVRCLVQNLDEAAEAQSRNGHESGSQSKHDLESKGEVSEERMVK